MNGCEDPAQCLAFLKAIDTDRRGVGEFVLSPVTAAGLGDLWTRHGTWTLDGPRTLDGRWTLDGPRTLDGRWTPDGPRTLDAEPRTDD